MLIILHIHSNKAPCRGVDYVEATEAAVSLKKYIILFMYAKYQISMYSKKHLNISKIMDNLDNIYM
jgi:hypothetical protein